MAPQEETGAGAQSQSQTNERLGSSEVAEACPAFLEGCPYATSADLLEWLKAKKPDEAGLCPAFDTGCPFRQVRDLEALKHELQKLPASHAGKTEQPSAEPKKSTEATPAHATLVEMLQLVHQASQSVKETVGADCPVFQSACPFKNCVTSSGMPLVLALEVRSWGFIIEEHEDGTEESEGAGEAESTPAPAPGTEQTIDGEGLAKKLKLGTQEAHKAAETVHFVREFIKGKVPREVYAQMVVNLFYVYQALEEALDKCADHELVDPLHFPDELCRADALARDAEFFNGPDWREKTSPSEVTKEYVSRLQQVANEAPELIVPHAYTRYLGDLSGGQVLKRAAIRGMKLPDDGSGVQFYTFRRIADGKAFKNMYRARLDALTADTKMADRMVVEANLAFGLNTRMFQELDVLMGFDISEIPAPPPVSDAPPSAAALAACPFAALAANGVPMPANHPSIEADHAALKAPKKAAKGKPSASSGRTTTAGLARRCLPSSAAHAAAALAVAVAAVAMAWASSGGEGGALVS